MDFFKTAVCLFVFCTLARAKVVEKRDAEAATVEDLIRQELERFAGIQDALEQSNLNMTVVLWHETKDEDGNQVRLDSVQFFSRGSKFNPNGPQVTENVTEEQLKEVFETAERLDMTAVVSQEKFLEDASLSARHIYLEDIQIHYSDGNSHIIFEDMEGSLSEGETTFESYLDILRGYEMPVEVEVNLYDEAGEFVRTDATKYVPRKVKIVSSNYMPEGMQMKAAEALKRAFVMKKTGKERMALLCRYLGIQYSDYKWQAIIGDGAQSVTYSVLVKLKLDGDTYTIWGVDQ